MRRQPPPPSWPTATTNRLLHTGTRGHRDRDRRARESALIRRGSRVDGNAPENETKSPTTPSPRTSLWECLRDSRMRMPVNMCAWSPRSQSPSRIRPLRTIVPLSHRSSTCVHSYGIKKGRGSSARTRGDENGSATVHSMLSLLCVCASTCALSNLSRAPSLLRAWMRGRASPGTRAGNTQSRLWPYRPSVFIVSSWPWNCFSTSARGVGCTFGSFSCRP